MKQGRQQGLLVIRPSPVLDEGKTVGAVARDMDLTETAVREWVKRARQSNARPHRADHRRARGARPAP